MKLLISGLCGHMGTEVYKLALAGCRGADPAGIVGVDMNACGAEGCPTAHSYAEAEAQGAPFTTVDCIVDFSHHSATPALLDYAVANNIPVVLATTGHTEEEKAAITKAAETIPVFFAANFSLGVALLIDTARQVAAAMPEAEIEIIEKHHNQKIDAPSGTALMLGEAVAEGLPYAPTSVFDRHAVREKRDPHEIGFSSVRGGTIVGEHEIIFAGHDEIMEIKHTALSREIFAQGAVEAAKFISGVEAPGLYDMADMLR